MMKFLLSLVVMMLAAGGVQAQQELLTDKELQQGFAAASEQFQDGLKPAQKQATKPKVTQTITLQDVLAAEGAVAAGQSQQMASEPAPQAPANPLILPPHFGEAAQLPEAPQEMPASADAPVVTPEKQPEVQEESVAEELSADDVISEQVDAMLAEKAQEQKAAASIVAQEAEKTPSMIDMKPAEQIEVKIVNDESEQRIRMSDRMPQASLSDIVVVIDVDDATLAEVMDQIIDQASVKGAPWQVKWRIKQENMALQNTRVNLTAETDLDNFMGHLFEHVNNMTGVQLFARVFRKTRVIVISDTY